MKILSLISLLAYAVTAAPTGKLDQKIQRRAPGGVTLRSTTYGGSGCPQGSVNARVEDGQVLPVSFDRFVVSTGPGVAADQTRRFCQFNFDLIYPAGWQYSVLSTTWDGYADLDDGVNGRVETTYYFSGQTDQVTTAMGINGPYSGNYVKSDAAAWSSWSPCGSEGLLNVKSDIRVNGQNSGVLGMDTATAHFAHKIYLNWRQC